jgi:hypothetical protein
MRYKATEATAPSKRKFKIKRRVLFLWVTIFETEDMSLWLSLREAYKI